MTDESKFCTKCGAIMASGATRSAVKNSANPKKTKPVANNGGKNTRAKVATVLILIICILGFKNIIGGGISGTWNVECGELVLKVEEQLGGTKTFSTCDSIKFTSGGKFTIYSQGEAKYDGTYELNDDKTNIYMHFDTSYGGFIFEGQYKIMKKNGKLYMGTNTNWEAIFEEEPEEGRYVILSK